jgi:type I restriction enzyme S subunit
MVGEWPSHTVVALQREGALLVEDGNHGEYRPRPDEFVAAGVAFIRAADMGSGRVLFDRAAKITERARARITKGIGAPGDVLLSHKGTVGKVALVQMDAPAFVCSPQTTFWRTLDESRIDRGYLYAFLRSQRFQAQLATRASETDMAPYVSLTSQRALSVVLPPIAEQRGIAHFLGTLDDKIELNRRMNETLEAIARANFKSWFIDFAPVRAKASGELPESICHRLGLAPDLLALFPDRLVDSELGEIPEGWEVRPLDEIADYLNGLALQKFPPESESEWLPVIKIAQLKSGSTVGADHASHRLNPDYVVDDGDVLFSWSGSLEVDVWCGGRGALNQHLFKVTSTCYPKWFFFHWTRQHLPHFRAIAAGKAVTMGHIQRRHLTEALCAVPRGQLLDQADGVIAPMFQYQIENRRQSRTLAATRDAVLPKLLSGELRVSVEGAA